MISKIVHSLISLNVKATLIYKGVGSMEHGTTTTTSNHFYSVFHGGVCHHKVELHRTASYCLLLDCFCLLDISFTFVCRCYGLLSTVGF